MSRLLRSILSGLAASVALGYPCFAEDASYSRIEDVIYGRKFGTALTFDVFTPKKDAKGVGVVFAVSGGWYSSHEGIPMGLIEPIVARGYTVFAVVHGSQPKFTIPEVLADMNRAVRFIRHHAQDYGIDPARIGIYGGSAGGHLSLMQGTAGDAGNPEAKDPVDRESSRVQAVACFFPPTDFFNYGKPGEDALGRGILKDFAAPFDFHVIDPARKKFVEITDEEKLQEIGRAIAPAYHVSPDDPPTLIVHGDADKLVPIQQAELIVEKLKEVGVPAKLVVKAGAAHGWPDMGSDLAAFADWFDLYLKKPEPAKTSARTRADQPPRKVVIGTTIQGPWGKPEEIGARLDALGALVDEMAQEASRKYPGDGLDLAVLTESAVSHTSGPPSARAVQLHGAIQEALGAIARKHNTYLVAPMDLVEQGLGGTTYANAAVLFDRQGKMVGYYRKAHPVAVLGTDELEGGIKPGSDYPVFDCDFGKLGIQICWDVQFEEGWKVLGDRGAEIVAWPTASPATAQPASRAAANRYFVVSSTWREDATIFEPTGLVAAQVESPGKVLIHQVDLSHALLGWSSPLRNGQALSEKFGDKVGYHYEPREDLGLFWSNDPRMTIGQMIESLGLEEIDAQVERNRRLQDEARGGPTFGHR
ncbi:nitrilase-related carbon-nitrogen hydrolase [Tundrisphaera lichenicola]|uniref:nitrilase-related carbon-nitrogen hydrolase n=1 Tax=Tundrisphaera lichenicola TaxID=2029860 RepID=UPI003EBA701F